MFKTISGVLGLIVIGTICLFVACACIVSNRIEERENKDEIEHK